MASDEQDKEEKRLDILTRVPVEVAHHILDFLGPKDACSCYDVSTRWRSLVSPEHIHKFAYRNPECSSAFESYSGEEKFKLMRWLSGTPCTETVLEFSTAFSKDLMTVCGHGRLLVMVKRGWLHIYSLEGEGLAMIPPGRLYLVLFIGLIKLFNTEAIISNFEAHAEEVPSSGGAMELMLVVKLNNLVWLYGFDHNSDAFHLREVIGFHATWCKPPGFSWFTRRRKTCVLWSTSPSVHTPPKEDFALLVRDSLQCECSNSASASLLSGFVTNTPVFTCRFDTCVIMWDMRERKEVMSMDVEKPNLILRNCWDGRIVAFATECQGKAVLCYNLLGQLTYVLEMGSRWHRCLKDIVAIKNTQLVVGLVEEYVHCGRPYPIPSVFLSVWKVETKPCRELQAYLSRPSNLKAYAQKKKDSRGNYKAEWAVDVDSCDLHSAQLFACKDSTVVCCLNGDRRTLVYTFALDASPAQPDNYLKHLRTSVIDFISSPLPATYFTADFGNIVLLAADYGLINVYLVKGEGLKECEMGFQKLKKLYYADRNKIICIRSRNAISVFGFSGVPNLETPKVLRFEARN